MPLVTQVRVRGLLVGVILPSRRDATCSLSPPAVGIPRGRHEVVQQVSIQFHAAFGWSLRGDHCARWRLCCDVRAGRGLFQCDPSGAGFG